MKTFQNKDGKKVLLSMVKAIQDNKAYLGEVDGLIGDGDHGANMNKGFTMFEEECGDSIETFSAGLLDLGMILLNEIGGSMGPIYGTIFMAISDELEDCETIDLKKFADAMQAGLESLYDIIDARVGDKTLVDTLCPAVESLLQSKEEGKDFADALEDMKKAAELGMQSTKNLMAKYGRSARLGERSIGVLDAGSVSCFLILQAMAGAMEECI